MSGLTVQIKALPWLEPVAAFAPFAELPGSVLLETVVGGGHSLIGLAPDPWIEGRFGDQPDGFARLARLGQALAPLDAADQHALRALGPFTGGVMGFFGYEMGGVRERLPAAKPGAPELSDYAFGHYPIFLTCDHRRRRMWAVAVSSEGEDTARARLAWCQARLEAAPAWPAQDEGPRLDWVFEMAADAYRDAFTRLSRHIRDGDVYQANLTQRVRADRPAGLTPLTLYRRLRQCAPAPHAACLILGQGAVVSASPERFLAVNAAGQIETRPIKGTRKRGASMAQDRALAAELLASGKDRAENLMIVDLMRNDLSRVCQPGSVAVPRLCALESFRTVHHLVSTVTGRLAPGYSAADAFASAFPGGSITGAPKIRAQQIIHDLEPVPRGPYCGSIFWWGRDGAFDSSILIRTLSLDRHAVYAQAGGGIVADSGADDEYQESLTKLAGLLAVAEPMDPSIAAQQAG